MIVTSIKIALPVRQLHPIVWTLILEGWQNLQSAIIAIEFQNKTKIKNLQQKPCRNHIELRHSIAWIQWDMCIQSTVPNMNSLGGRKNGPSAKISNYRDSTYRAFFLLGDMQGTWKFFRIGKSLNYTSYRCFHRFQIWLWSKPEMHKSCKSQDIC